MNIPILLYHRISEPEERTSLCVPTERFLQQMEYLAKNGYNVVSLYDIVSYIKGVRPLPPRSLAITFDDGYRDNYINAFPILKKYGFTAAFFLVADSIGKTNKWDEPHWPTAELMDWREITEMSGAGFLFGSHGYSHIRLNKPKFIPLLRRELGISKTILRRGLNKDIDFFSFPFGKFNIFAKLMLGIYGYKGACTTKEPKKGERLRDPYLLPRVEINTNNCSVDDFAKTLKKITAPSLNIMQVCTKDSWGGQELYPVSLTKRLKQRGHNITFVLRSGSPIETSAKEAAQNIERLKVRASLDPNAILKLVLFIKKHNIDVVHAHTPKDYCPSIIAAKLAGVKVVVTRHLLTPLNTATLLALRHADRVLAVSGAVKDSLTNNNVLNPDKIEVLYNGVDIDIFNAKNNNGVNKRKDFGFEKNDFIIGNVGHMGCKGQPEIIHALKNICQKYPKTKCLFVAEDPVVEDLERMAEGLGIRKNIVFEGYRTDIPGIMSMIDLFVMAPKLEAFGIVLIEAMACAKPVISTLVGGIPEVVKDGVNGWLVPYKDIGALEGAILKVIEDPARAKEMGAQGNRIARERFDLKKSIDRIEEVYHSVMP